MESMRFIFDNERVTEATTTSLKRVIPITQANQMIKLIINVIMTTEE